MIARDLRENVSDLTADAALTLTFNLIDATPVDTGWAQAHWRPQLGRRGANSARIPEVPEAKTLADKIERLPAAKNAQNAAVSAVANYKQGRIFITNPVPYIGRLNEGYSPQAPPNFVELAVRKSRRSFSTKLRQNAHGRDARLFGIRRDRIRVRIGGDRTSPVL